MSENSERIAKNCERKKLDFEKSIRTFIIYGFKRILKKKFNLAKRVTKNSQFFHFTEQFGYLLQNLRIYKILYQFLGSK